MSSTELVRHVDQTVAVAVSPAQLRERINRIQEVIKDIMIEDKHYGKMPGMPRDSKPVLFKAGSELLLSMFGVSIEPVIEDLSGPDEVRYRMTAKATSIANGTELGSGVGECSSNEEKYKWRSCGPKEFAATDEMRKRIKYRFNRWAKPNEEAETEERQVRTNPPDLANTILKMALKRAVSDAVLRVLACSDCFEQEEMGDPDYVDAQGDNTRRNEPQAERKPVQRKSESNNGAGEQKLSGKRVSDKQVGFMFAEMKKAGHKTEDDLKPYLVFRFKTDSPAAIPVEIFPEVLDWVRAPKADTDPKPQAPAAAANEPAKEAEAPKDGKQPATAEQMGFNK